MLCLGLWITLYVSSCFTSLPGSVCVFLSFCGPVVALCLNISFYAYV